MSARERRTFPLVPRRRLTGLPFGDLPSRRRGHGTEVIGSRPYEPGDPVSTIDWFASARLSSASGGDEFIVRDRAADEAPRVTILLDRRPAMGLYPPPFPWLSKREALREAAISIAASAAVARADIAALDYGTGEPWWLPPGRRDRPWIVAARAAEAPFEAPEDNVVQALTYLAQRRTDVPGGTFLFVISDFLEPVPPDAWLDAVGHGWDVVPVVIQDPVWERSWPEVAGVGLPVADAGLVRLGRRQAARLRSEHEARYAGLLAELQSVGLRPVELDSSEPYIVDEAFLAWAEERRRGRWAR
ncbi:MAG TPA: DUF58 domain-containing protein [Gaiellaceae bacterium]|jgi:uncharacterized protein (DUF58 family)|nr:DUF58 domain-containing protein [Gaiellaceae bacterium]